MILISFFWHKNSSSDGQITRNCVPEAQTFLLTPISGYKPGCKLLSCFGGQEKQRKKFKITFLWFLLTINVQTKNILYYSISLETKNRYFGCIGISKFFSNKGNLKIAENWKLRDSFETVVWPFLPTVCIFSIFFYHIQSL